MKQLIMMALGLSVAAVPALASANRVRDVSLTANGEDVVIAVTAEEPIAAPHLRTSRGGIKMWIPNIEEDTRLEIEGDGRAIDRLRLRPGASGSALLHVDLNSSRRLPARALRVEVLEDKAVLRLPKRLLPEWAEPIAKPEPAPVPVQAAPAAATPPVAAAPTSPLAPTAAPAGTPLTALQQVPEKTSLAAMATAKGPLDNGDEDRGAMPYALLLMGVAGGAAFLLLRKMQKGRSVKVPDLTDIQVLGVRRLGPRHQLILVRALGEDHLLSMNGDRTERIASMPSSDSTLGLPPELKALPEQATPEDHYRDLMAAARSRTDRVSVPVAANENGTGTPFGGELLTFMNRRTKSITPPSEERPSSPSIEGLLRLRREVG